MQPIHKITIHHKQEGKTYSFEVPEGEYILRNFESKDENGQIIISTLSNIVYDVDQDVDSEGEELNQSRLDMKRIVGDSVRFSGGGSSNNSSRNKKENSVRVPQKTTQ